MMEGSVSERSPVGRISNPPYRAQIQPFSEVVPVEEITYRMSEAAQGNSRDADERSDGVVGGACGSVTGVCCVVYIGGRQGVFVMCWVLSGWRREILDGE